MLGLGDSRILALRRLTIALRMTAADSCCGAVCRRREGTGLSKHRSLRRVAAVSPRRATLPATTGSRDLQSPVDLLLQRRADAAVSRAERDARLSSKGAVGVSENRVSTGTSLFAPSSASTRSISEPSASSSVTSAGTATWPGASSSPTARSGSAWTSVAATRAPRPRSAAPARGRCRLRRRSRSPCARRPASCAPAQLHLTVHLTGII